MFDKKIIFNFLRRQNVENLKGDNDSYELKKHLVIRLITLFGCNNYSILSATFFSLYNFYLERFYKNFKCLFVPNITMVFKECFQEKK